MTCEMRLVAGADGQRAAFDQVACRLEPTALAPSVMRPRASSAGRRIGEWIESDHKGEWLISRDPWPPSAPLR